MTLKKYIKLNQKYLLIVIAWIVLTLGFTVYKTNFSNNFYIEAADTTITNIKSLEIRRENKTISKLKPEVNGDKAYVDYKRLNDISLQYKLKINLDNGTNKVIVFPYTTDTDYLKVRLLKLDNSYVLMAVSDKTSVPLLVYTLLWGTLALLLLTAVYDFFKLRKAYNMPKHTILLYLEQPTPIRELTLTDPLLKTSRTYTKQEIVKANRNGYSILDATTVLFSKTRSIKIKAKMTNGDVALYKKQLMRYTPTTTIVFSNKNYVIIDGSNNNVDNAINAYKVKER